MFRFMLFSLGVVGLCVGGPADFIKKCKSSDSKCIKESTVVAIPAFVKGIPELGIEPMDPLFLKEIDASSPSLKLIVRDFNVVGLSTCKPKKIQRDVSKSQLYVRLICDVQADGLYEMKGNLLVVPIEGNDKLHLKINKIAINADCDMDTITKDGKKYWVIKDWRYSFELQEKSELLFEKLFENNEALRTAANTVVKEHSNEIIKDIGAPIIKRLAEIVVNSAKALLDHIPYDDLSLD